MLRASIGADGAVVALSLSTHAWRSVFWRLDLRFTITPFSSTQTQAMNSPNTVNRVGAAEASVPVPEINRVAILAAEPQLEPYVDNLERRGRKVVTLVLRHLLRLLRDYPREAFLGAIEEASRYGLYDLERVERMILRRVRREYFRLVDEEQDD